MHVRLLLLAVLAVVGACGPPPPPYGTPATSGPVTMRAPKNAPADPVGTSLPGTRSCNDTTDCKPGEACFAPDGKLAEPTAPAPCTHDCPAAPPSCAEPNAPICPQNLRCNPSSGACERFSCTSSASCDIGVCWRGQCFGHSGYCSTPPPAPPTLDTKPPSD